MCNISFTRTIMTTDAGETIELFGLRCTGEASPPHRATKMILIDGDFNGDACCNDESHAAHAIALAVDLNPQALI